MLVETKEVTPKQKGQAQAQPLAPPTAEQTHAPIIRRMELSGLNSLTTPWLVKRLQERHPTASPSAIVGWLRGRLYSNEAWLMQTDHAAALAEVIIVPLEIRPIVREVFVLAEIGYVDEAAFFYPAMAQWAQYQNASKVEFGLFSDVEAAGIRMQFEARLVFEKPALCLNLVV